MKPLQLGKGIAIGALILGGCVLIVFTLYKLAALVGYFFISLGVALVGRPIINVFENKIRIPKIPAVLLYLILVLSAASGIIALVIPTVAKEGEALLDVQIFESKLDLLHMRIREMGETGEVVDEVIEKGEIKEELVENIEQDIVPDLMSTIFEVLGSIGVGLFSVLFISFFFLYQGKYIQKNLLAPLPWRYKRKSILALNESKDLLSRYLLGLLMQLCIIFIFYASGLLMAGLENAILIAFIAALFNIVPYLGPLIGGGLMIFLTISNTIEMDYNSVFLPAIGFVLGGFLLGQLVDNLFSQPFIFSSSTKSHPLEIFTVIVAAGILFGIVGMIVAVPAYTVLRVVFKEFYIRSKINTTN